MPFTPNRAFKEAPRLVVRGEGIYLWSEAGDQIIDASSGLFTCAAGHCRSEIADAVDAQLRELDYTSHFGAGYPGSFKFASQLAALTPEGIDKIFFVNSGSEAVDTAIKIALAYHRARGQGQRMRMISRERAYHGVNVGGTSLSGMVKNREAFGTGLPGVAHLRHTWSSDDRFIKGQPENGAELAEDLQRMVALYGGETIAACFVEPVAGSTGVLVPPKGYLERLREICDENEILLIFDEVICGFGRLGTAFGADAFNVTPDIMTMAKALTNGAVPMGAVAVDNAIYDTVINTAPEGSVELFHGYTYSAHPIACAAGSAVLEIYKNESLFERAADLSDSFLDAVFGLSDIPAITDIRGYGLLAGFDLAPDVTPGLRGAKTQAALFDAGLHLKLTGDSGIIAPALIAKKSHIDEIVTKLRSVLSKL